MNTETDDFIKYNEMKMEDKFLFMCFLVEQHFDELKFDDMFRQMFWNMTELIFVNIDSMEEEYIVETKTTKRILKRK